MQALEHLQSKNTEIHEDDYIHRQEQKKRKLELLKDIILTIDLDSWRVNYLDIKLDEQKCSFSGEITLLPFEKK